MHFVVDRCITVCLFIFGPAANLRAVPSGDAKASRRPGAPAESS